MLCRCNRQSMTAPGVEPGLSQPQRDVLTTRRCGLEIKLAPQVRKESLSRVPAHCGHWPREKGTQTRRCREAPSQHPCRPIRSALIIHRKPQRLQHLCQSVMSELPLQATPRALTETPNAQIPQGNACPHQDLNLGCRGHDATS